jgi:hypothetical protein
MGGGEAFFDPHHEDSFPFLFHGMRKAIATHVSFNSLKNGGGGDTKPSGTYYLMVDIFLRLLCLPTSEIHISMVRMEGIKWIKGLKATGSHGNVVYTRCGIIWVPEGLFPPVRDNQSD